MMFFVPPLGSQPPKKQEETEEFDLLPDENDKVAWWRFESLIHAGFSADIALRLADTVEWRRAINMREGGATEDEIVHILE